jgi:hypothetical protein
MNDYLIGSGAVVTAGPSATITSATLHAQTDPALALQAKAVVVDFEGTAAHEITSLVAIGKGWTPARVTSRLIEPLLAAGECSLADLLALLATAAQASELHLFARWMPDELTTTVLRRAGIEVIVHPLEAIRQAALISGQRYSRWSPPSAA